jgi:thiol-disulfide isomerase/thioredoxin
MKKSFLFLLIIFLISYTVSAKSLQESMAENGLAIPKKTTSSINFELENLDGLKEQLTDYRGKVVFLNFWATWCGPCRIEMPSMERIYNEFQDDGMVILAVNLGESSAIAGEFMKSNNLSFPVLLDKDQTVATIYGVRSIPTSYLIDRDGNIMAMAVGAREWDSLSFRKLFREILKQ